MYKHDILLHQKPNFSILMPLFCSAGVVHFAYKCVVWKPFILVKNGSLYFISIVFFASLFGLTKHIRVSIHSSIVICRNSHIFGRNLSRRNSLIAIKNSSICMNSLGSVTLHHWYSHSHSFWVYQHWWCIAVKFYWTMTKAQRHSLLIINLILSASINCRITSNCHLFSLFPGELIQASRTFCQRIS